MMMMMMSTARRRHPCPTEALGHGDRPAERRVGAGVGGQRVLEHVEKGRWGEGGSR